MEKSVQDMILVGYHTFSSKDKTKIYYVVQCLYSEQNITKSSYKGTLINIFTEDEIYKKVVGLEIGTPIKVEVIPNLASGKVYYKVVV